MNRNNKPGVTLTSNKNNYNQNLADYMPEVPGKKADYGDQFIGYDNWSEYLKSYLLPELQYICNANNIRLSVEGS